MKWRSSLAFSAIVFLLIFDTALSFSKPLEFETLDSDEDYNYMDTFGQLEKEDFLRGLAKRRISSDEKSSEEALKKSDEKSSEEDSKKVTKKEETRRGLTLQNDIGINDFAGGSTNYLNTHQEIHNYERRSINLNNNIGIKDLSTGGSNNHVATNQNIYDMARRSAQVSRRSVTLENNIGIRDNGTNSSNNTVTTNQELYDYSRRMAGEDSEPDRRGIKLSNNIGINDYAGGSVNTVNTNQKIVSYSNRAAEAKELLDGFKKHKDIVAPALTTAEVIQVEDILIKETEGEIPETDAGIEEKELSLLHEVLKGAEVDSDKPKQMTGDQVSVLRGVLDFFKNPEAEEAEPVPELEPEVSNEAEGIEPEETPTTEISIEEAEVPVVDPELPLEETTDHVEENLDNLNENLYLDQISNPTPLNLPVQNPPAPIPVQQINSSKKDPRTQAGQPNVVQLQPENPAIVNQNGQIPLQNQQPQLVQQPQVQLQQPSVSAPIQQQPNPVPSNPADQTQFNPATSGVQGRADLPNLEVDDDIVVPPQNTNPAPNFRAIPKESLESNSGEPKSRRAIQIKSKSEDINDEGPKRKSQDKIKEPSVEIKRRQGGFQGPFVPVQANQGMNVLGGTVNEDTLGPGFMQEEEILGVDEGPAYPNTISNSQQGQMLDMNQIQPASNLGLAQPIPQVLPTETPIIPGQNPVLQQNPEPVVQFVPLNSSPVPYTPIENPPIALHQEPQIVAFSGNPAQELPNANYVPMQPIQETLPSNTVTIPRFREIPFQDNFQSSGHSLNGPPESPPPLQGQPISDFPYENLTPKTTLMPQTQVIVHNQNIYNAVPEPIEIPEDEEQIKPLGFKIGRLGLGIPGIGNFG